MLEKGAKEINLPPNSISWKRKMEPEGPLREGCSLKGALLNTLS